MCLLFIKGLVNLKMNIVQRHKRRTQYKRHTLHGEIALKFKLGYSKILLSCITFRSSIQFYSLLVEFHFSLKLSNLQVSQPLVKHILSKRVCRFQQSITLFTPSSSPLLTPSSSSTSPSGCINLKSCAGSVHSRLSTGKLTSSLKKFLLFIIIIIIMIKTMIIEVLSQSVRTDCQEKQEFTPYTNVQHQPHGGKQNCGKQHQHHVQANLKFLHYDHNDQFLRSVQIWPNFSLFFKLQFYNCLSSYSAEQICHFDITVTWVNFIGN